MDDITTTADGRLIVDPKFRSLIPPLTAAELSQLTANLKRDGCQCPLIVWQCDGVAVLLDGHNRHAICTEHGIPYTVTTLDLVDRNAAKMWIIHNQFGRRNLSLYQRADLALELEPLIAAAAKASQGTRTDLVPNSAQGSVGKTDERLAKIAGVGKDTIQKTRTINKHSDDETKEALRKGETTIHREYSRINTAERREGRIAKLNELSGGDRPLSDVPVRCNVLLADPPWPYEHQMTDNQHVNNQYPLMDLDAIRDMPIDDAVADDAVLFLWTPSPKLAEAMTVIEAWGFDYRTCAVWDKCKIGMGYYFRQRHELLLVATRGDVPIPAPGNRPASVFQAKRGRHSEKPECVHVMIEAMYPELSRLEMFARQARPGWHVWGNEV